MKIFRSIIKHVNILNILLLSAAAAMFAFAAIPLLADIPAPVTAPDAAKKIAVQQEVAAAPYQAPPYTDYVVIPEQNIFHSLRKMPPENKGEKLVLRPDLILYGTVMVDNARFAYVEDKRAPQPQPGQRKKQIVLREGASLNSYVLKVVEKDRIEMVKGDDRMVFYLLDLNKERSGETLRSSASPDKARPAGPAKPTPVAPAAKTPTRYGK